MADFFKEFSDQYGYDGKIDQIREKEYPQLKDAIYLDHAGTTTYAQSTLNSFHSDLSKTLYGNPHSKSPSSQLSTDRVNNVRARILKHFDANPDHYTVIFTANATSAIKLVGETFPWEKGATSFRYLREAHTSLLGLRSYAAESEVREIKPMTEDEIELDLQARDKHSLHHQNPHFHNDIPQIEFEGQTDGVPIINSGVTYNLFAYPAQCNFSGMRFPLDWTQKMKRILNTQNQKVLVLLDAAAYTTTSPLSLAETENSPDFVVVSFYKLFGYPTGLGALILKRELSPILKKRYFGGGTVTAVFWNMNWQYFHEELWGRYEDGTINFLDIIALDHAFNASDSLYKDFTHIRSHVTSLNQYLHRSMVQLRHWNSAPLCVINSDRDFSDSCQQGPIINFNLKRADGSWIGYNEVETLASANGIHVRTGGHCNPGSVARWMQVTPDDIENKSCHDDRDIVNGKPVGALRVSLGAMSTIDEIFVWIDFLKTLFVESEPPIAKFKGFNDIAHDFYDKFLGSSISNGTREKSQLELEIITLFPIKSCHGYVVHDSVSWPLTSQGLLYDREWMIVNSENGQALSQKKYPRMALIRPKVLIDEGVLQIKASGQAPLRIALEDYPENISSTSICSSSRVFGESIDALYYTNSKINEWFSNFLGLSCILARQPKQNQENPENMNIRRRFIKPHLKASATAPLSLSNESPFLLISKSSVNDVNEKIRESGKKEIETDCFRGNFVVRGAFRFEEDEWSVIRIGGQAFKIIGPCRRCYMVTVNQTTGEKTSEPYATLRKHRNFNVNGFFCLPDSYECSAKMEITK
ncbi:hypothetical protein G9A89_015524 [Geosiphon pyriformis]|nr:hypothetical protein G9A89_015524 [Geosiphon pyriformis]